MATAIERSINAINIVITEYEKMLKVPHIGTNMVMLINGQLDELNHVTKVLKDFLLLEKQQLQKAFEAGQRSVRCTIEYRPYGDMEEYSKMIIISDFDQFYSQLKGE